MIIDNKDLYNLYKSVKIDYDNYGLYVEGFQGGVNVYVTDEKAIFRKTFTGDNKKVFISCFSDWRKKDGVTDIKDLMNGEKDHRNMIPKMKAYLETEKFNKIMVDGKEFKQAIKAVDAINRGGRKHEIILSIHNGKFDLASWSGEDTAFWQLDGDYEGNGAIMVDRKYLDGVKATELSYSVYDNKTVLHIRGDLDAVIMPKRIGADDIKSFSEVLEYEYKAPEKIAETVTVKEPELKLVTSEKPWKEMVKRALKPKKENGAFIGWTYNELGTKQVKVCNW